MERLHWLLERAFDEDINQLSHTFTAVTTISCLPRLASVVMATVHKFKDCVRCKHVQWAAPVTKLIALACSRVCCAASVSSYMPRPKSAQACFPAACRPLATPAQHCPHVLLA